MLGASLTLEKRIYQGKTLRQNGRIEIEVVNNATTAVSWVEFAVFLGVPLAESTKTRLSALPTVNARRYPGGGLAFRSAAVSFVPPKAKRTVELKRAALPKNARLGTVRARVSDCRQVRVVGEATISLPLQRDERTQNVLIGASLLLTVGLVVMLARALR